MKKLLITLICLCLCPGVFAKSIHLKAGHPVEYTVQPGDTLWGLASRFLDDPLEWPELFRENPQIQSPSRIYPGQVLELAMINGQPALHVKPGGTIKLSPRVRSEPLDNAIPVIPVSTILPFLDATRVVSKAEIERAPLIVAQSGEHVVTGDGDEIYVEGLSKEDDTEFYFIYRLDDPYVDPETKKILGYEALHVGQAKVIREGSPSTLLVTQVNREVLVGDRLLPIQSIELNQDFFPTMPDYPVNGRIISVLDGVTQVGQYQVVVINRGKQDNLDVGDVLAVYQTGKRIRNPIPDKKRRDIQLPDERAGVLMVFRTFDKVSYGLILHATQPIHILDKVVNRVG